MTSPGGDTLAGLSCSNGQVAAWNSSSSEWECADGGTGGGSGSDTEGISVYGSTTSITSAGATIAFGTVRENDFGAGAWDGSAFTVPVGKGGWYALSAGLSMGAAGAGKTGLYIRVNGATLMGQRDIDASASFTTVQNVSTLHKLADGDVVTVMGQTDSGTFTAANNVLTYFSATKIGGGGGGTDTLAGLSCTDGQVAAWNAAGSEWECADGGTGGGDGSPFVFCTNENSNGDTTDDLDACVGATNVTSVEYRALSCQYTGITDRAYSGDYIRWNGTKWVFRAYNGTEYDCVDGTVMVADATATGGTGSGTDTLSELNCTNSQVAAWNSASGSWQCANINGFGGFEGGEGGGDDANVVKNDNLPEAITCANGTDSRVFYFFRKQPSAGWVEYRERSNGYLIQFNMADKTFVSTNYSGSNCANKSIATLTSEGKTFKFTEGATGTIIAGFPDVIECDYGTSNERYYYIAWSNATKTRYRDSGNYYYDFDNTTKAWVADNLNTSCRNQSIANIQASNFDYELVGGDQSKTFLEGIPDAIFCKDTAGDSYMYSVSLDYDDGDIRYYTLNGSYYVEFYESTGAYKGNNRVTDCNNKSLSDLQDAGVTANFVDKNGTDVPEVVEDDYAYNGWPDLIVCTGAGTNHVLRLGSYNSTNFEYEDMSSGISYMRFNRDTKAWVAEDPDITTTDCTGKSLAELETAGLTRALKGGGAETSMVPGYPDVLACLASAGSDMYYFHYGSNDGTYIRYHWTGSTSHYIRFNSADGTWQADSVNTVCRNKTLTQLQSEGLSYNLLGGTDSGSMETGWPDVMKCEYGGFPELYFIGDLDLDASPYVTYRSSRGRYVRWNRDGGTFNASSGGSTCHNKSYDQVMLEGRGMNLVNTDNASSQSNGMYNQASMIENFPDALACRELNSLTNDVYVYWIRYNNNNLVRYESYYTSASIMLNFSENGIFSSSDATILTDCEGKSIDELIAYGQAFYLNGGGGGGSFASDTLADLSCNTGQVAAWDGDSWECADGGIGGGGSGSGQDVSFRVDKNGTNQTVTANTNVVLTWSREIFDTNDDFDLGTGRFTPTVAGKYLLTLNGNCSDNTSSCNVQIRKNGTPIANAHVNTATAGQNHSISTIVDMNGTTDYVDATVYNGGGTTVNGNVSLANFTGALIGGGGSGGGGDTLAGLSCTDGQVASWSDAALITLGCADGGTGGGGGGWSGCFIFGQE
ncbi:MAG: hypothetical protein LRZ85_09200 [Alphaproteobacteria bacterium]|nr:hypothetical protein [Alphaproteobacteria bacterium]